VADTTSEGKEFLGAGIAFPLGVDRDRHMAMHRLEEQVRQSIVLILGTAKGERVMRPDFGSGLHKLVFEPLTPITCARVQHEVQEALVRFEPRIEVTRVEVTIDARQRGRLLINIAYRVRRTDTFFNLVYPFYLERGEL
jgi:phage baseplate assembly protein W